MKTEPDSIVSFESQRRIKLLGVEVMPSEVMLNLGIRRAFEKLGNFLGQQEQKIPGSYRKYIWILLAMAYCFILAMQVLVEKQDKITLNQIQIPIVIPPDPVSEIVQISMPLDGGEDCNTQP